MQNQLSEITCEGSAAWGKIKIKMDGNQTVLDVSIDGELLSDKDDLQKAIKEAFNDAIKQIHKQMAYKLKDMGGLDALKNLGSGG